MNNPTCPHCGYEFDDDETWHTSHQSEYEVYNGDGDQSTVKCHNLDCQKVFHLMCVHDIRWKPVDEDGNDL